MKRASLHAFPAETWRANKTPAVRTLFALKPKLAVTCAYCGAGLEGRRKDARFCCDSHRALASKRAKGGLTLASRDFDEQLRCLLLLAVP